jgi:hypothetical protein
MKQNKILFMQKGTSHQTQPKLDAVDVIFLMVKGNS